MQNLSHLSVAPLLGAALLCFLPTGCADVGVEGPLEKLELLAVDDTPGCSTERPSSFASDPPADTLEGQTLRQMRDIADIELSFDTQLPLLMTRPIVAHPEATTWDDVREGARIEAEVVSAGDTWAMIRSVLTVGPADDAEGSHVADIDISAGRTRYVIDGRTFDVTPDTLRYDGGARGCDPSTGISFAVAPRSIVAGEVRNGPLCWPEEGLTLLTCAQIVERML